MTVKELIERLTLMEPIAKVVVEYDGSHCEIEGVKFHHIADEPYIGRPGYLVVKLLYNECLSLDQMGPFNFFERHTIDATHAG